MERFKTWLEVSVVPHMPAQFFRELQERLHHIHATIQKLVQAKERNIKYVKDMIGSYHTNNLDDFFWPLERMDRYLGNVSYQIDYIVGLLDREERSNNFRKDLSRLVSKEISELLPKINFDDLEESLNKLENEVKDAKDTGWEDEWYGKYEDMVDFIHLLKKGSLEIKRFQRWYPRSEEYISSMMDSIDRSHEKYYSGKTILPKHENVEVLYHATTALSAILREGFKTRKELGGRGALGGGPDDEISFTGDARIAEAIVWALRRAVEIAQGKMDVKHVQFLARKVGIPWETILNTQKGTYGNQGIDTKYSYVKDRWHPEVVSRTEMERRDWLFNAFKALLMHQHKYYNPVFFDVTANDFVNINPREIGIIAAEVDMSQVKTYLPSMEEYRVPISAIGKVSKFSYRGVERPYLA